MHDCSGKSLSSIKERKGGGVHGSMMPTVQDKLQEYKKLIDFSDSMQKNNYKFIERFVRKEKISEDEMLRFLQDAIEILCCYHHYKKEKEMM